jgi:hypothetical protein
MRGYGGEDHTINTREAFKGCGKRDGKGANKRKEGEGIG